MFPADVPTRHSLGDHHRPEGISSPRQSVGAASETGESADSQSKQTDSISILNIWSFQVTEHVLQLQDYVNTMAKLQVDEQEYAYLKTIALFSPGKNSWLELIYVADFINL